MVPPRPITELGPSSDSLDTLHPSLTPQRLTQLRAILLAVSLLLGLAAYVFHTISTVRNATPPLITKLRGVGVMTWIYALIQLIDLRFYNSRWTQKRRTSTGLPDSLHGWLLGQMLAWFGILYYGLTEDVRWYVAGLVILTLTFLAFPIRHRE